MSKNNKNTYNKIIIFATALIAPYLYFFTVRPQLINLENKLENKITAISDDELNQMKIKLETSKKEKLEKNKISEEESKENDEIKKI
jgi:hypothetical protein